MRTLDDVLGAELAIAVTIDDTSFVQCHNLSIVGISERASLMRCLQIQCLSRNLRELQAGDGTVEIPWPWPEPDNHCKRGWYQGSVPARDYQQPAQ